MPRIERVRDVLKKPAEPGYFQRMESSGWKLVAVEWAREVEGAEHEFGELADYVPYGLQVAGDCLHLEENPEEIEVLTVMMEVIVQDQPLSKVAEELNRRGFRTRQGWKWSQVSVFHLLPRLIEMGPRIFSGDEWAERRKILFRM
jgi:hypothetical protein